MKTPRPLSLTEIEPELRMFPASWRDQAIFEELREVGYVTCSGCLAKFLRRAELRTLEADHIHPFSKGGMSTWENLQLLCRACNRSKRDRLM